MHGEPDPVRELIGVDSTADDGQPATTEHVTVGPHADPERPAADDEPSSITYRASESELISELLDVPTPVNVNTGTDRGSDKGASDTPKARHRSLRTASAPGRTEIPAPPSRLRDRSVV